VSGAHPEAGLPVPAVRLGALELAPHVQGKTDAGSVPGSSNHHRSMQ
jgi:hypothetical protein